MSQPSKSSSSVRSIVSPTPIKTTSGPAGSTALETPMDQEKLQMAKNLKQNGVAPAIIAESMKLAFEVVVNL